LVVLVVAVPTVREVLRNLPICLRRCQWCGCRHGLGRYPVELRTNPNAMGAGDMWTRLHHDCRFTRMVTCVSFVLGEDGTASIEIAGNRYMVDRETVALMSYLDHNHFSFPRRGHFARYSRDAATRFREHMDDLMIRP